MANTNNIDLLTSKTVSWVDQVFSFGNKYSDLIVWGIVAMMVAKMAKFKISLGGKK